MNKLFKRLIYGGELSLSVIESTDMVNDAIKIHGLTPTTAAALGRAMTAATFMASDLKNKEDRLYVVVAGDCLWNIAYRFYGSGRYFGIIADANGIKPPYTIYVGQTLIIPAL